MIGSGEGGGDRRRTFVAPLKKQGGGREKVEGNTLTRSGCKMGRGGRTESTSSKKPDQISENGKKKPRKG